MPYTNYSDVLPYYSKVFINLALGGTGGAGTELDPYRRWADVPAGAKGSGKACLFKALPRDTAVAAAQVDAGAATGSAGAPWIIGAYGIDESTGATHAPINGTGIAFPVYLPPGTAYVTLMDLAVWGSTTGSSPISSTSTLVESVTLDRVLVGPNPNTSDTFSNACTIYGNNTKVLRSVFSGCQADTLWLKGSNLLVEDVDVWDSGQGPDLAGDGIQLADWGGNTVLRRVRAWSARQKSALQASDCITDGGVLTIEDCELWAAQDGLGSMEGSRCFNFSGTNARTFTMNYRRNLHRRGLSAAILSVTTAQELFYFDGNGACTLNLESNLFDGKSNARSLVYLYGTTGSANVWNSRGNTYGGHSPSANNECLLSAIGASGTSNSLSSIDDHFCNAGAYTNTGSTITAGSLLSSATIVNGHFDREYTNMVELKGSNKSSVAAINASAGCSGNTTGDSLTDSEYQPRAGSPLLSGGSASWRKNAVGARIYAQRGAWGRMAAP